METSKYGVAQFRSEIRRLIAEISTCIRADRNAAADREYDLQQQAFEERCRQAEQLARTLGSATPGKADDPWAFRDGDAFRIQESLKLSLDYFRRS
jgi:hypothetical protein